MSYLIGAAVGLLSGVLIGVAWQRGRVVRRVVELTESASASLVVGDWVQARRYTETARALLGAL